MGQFSRIIESRHKKRSSGNTTRIEKSVYIDANLILDGVNVGDVIAQLTNPPTLTVLHRDMMMRTSEAVVFTETVNAKRIYLNHRDLYAEMTALGVLGGRPLDGTDTSSGTLDVRGRLLLCAQQTHLSTVYYDVGHVMDAIASGSCINTQINQTCEFETENTNPCDTRLFQSPKDFIVIPTDIGLYVGAYNVREVMTRLNTKSNVLCVDVSLLKEKHIERAQYDVCTRDVVVNGKSMHHFFDEVASNMSTSRVTSNVPYVDVQQFEGDILVQCDTLFLSIRTLLDVYVQNLICDMAKTVVLHCPIHISGHDVHESLIRLSERVPGAHDLELKVDPVSGHLSTSNDNVIILEDELILGDIVTPDGINIRIWLEDVLCKLDQGQDAHAGSATHKAFPGTCHKHANMPFTRFPDRIVLCGHEHNVPCYYDLSATIHTTSTCVVEGSLFVIGRVCVSEFDILSSLVCETPTYVIDCPMKAGDVRIDTNMYVNSMVLYQGDACVDIGGVLRLSSPRKCYGSVGSLDISYCGTLQVHGDVFMRVSVTKVNQQPSESFVSLRSLLGESKIHDEVTWSKSVLSSCDEKKKLFVTGRCVVSGVDMSEMLARSGRESVILNLIDDGRVLESDVEFEDVVFSENMCAKSLAKHLGLDSTRHRGSSKIYYTNSSVLVRDHRCARSEKRFFDLFQVCREVHRDKRTEGVPF